MAAGVEADLPTREGAGNGFRGEDAEAAEKAGRASTGPSYLKDCSLYGFAVTNATDPRGEEAARRGGPPQRGAAPRPRRAGGGCDVAVGLDDFQDALEGAIG